MPLRKRQKPVQVRKDPDDFVFSDFLLPKTKVDLARDGEFRQFTTTLPDGVKIAWANCGRCLQWATLCTCRDIIHPSGIEWCWIKAKMKKDGIPEAREQVVFDAMVITERAVYWYRKPRPSSSRHALVTDPPLHRDSLTPAVPIPGPVTGSGPALRPKRIIKKSRAEKDRDAMDVREAELREEQHKKVLKKVKSAPLRKKIRRIS